MAYKDSPRCAAANPACTAVNPPCTVVHILRGSQTAHRQRQISSSCLFPLVQRTAILCRQICPDHELELRATCRPMPARESARCQRVRGIFTAAVNGITCAQLQRHGPSGGDSAPRAGGHTLCPRSSRTTHPISQKSSAWCAFLRARYHSFMVNEPLHVHAVGRSLSSA